MPPDSLTSSSQSDALLLRRAENWRGIGNLAELTAATLCQISSREGMDFATALLYDRVIHAPEHACFISAIDTAQPTPSKRNQRITIALLPAAFYKEKPRSGADGRLVREEALRLGFRCEPVPLLSIGTLAENSALLLDWLARHQEEDIILVSLCKSGSDVKFALKSPDAKGLFNNVFAWINICGTLSGSPLAQRMLGSKRWSLATWLYFKGSRHHLQFLRELIPQAGGPLDFEIEMPISMRLISLVGFPLQEHLTNAFMRRCHATIAHYGPNDGGVLLHEVCSLPGSIYPIWGADHYLRPEERSRQLISATLDYLAGVYPSRTASIPRNSSQTSNRANVFGVISRE
jgi:hypothetical protein